MAMRRLGNLAVFVLLASASSALGGCGAVYYTAQIHSAESRVEQARAVGAEQFAPYEFYFAEEHLKKAKTEASEASYGEAATYAEVSEEYARKAIDLAKVQKAKKAP
jgi:hypothetical protein